MAQRGRPRKFDEPWFRQVADLMTHEHMTFTHACMALGKKFTTSAEEREYEFSNEFQAILNELHIRYFCEMGANPLIGKDYCAGIVEKTVQKLMEMNLWDKVTAAVHELGEIKGFKKVDAETPVLANLTQADIDRIRKELKEKEAEVRQNAEPAPVQIVIVGDGEKPN